MAHPTRAYPCFPEGTVSIMIPSWMGYHSTASLLLSISLRLSDNLLLSIYTPWWREALWQWNVTNHACLLKDQIWVKLNLYSISVLLALGHHQTHVLNGHHTKIKRNKKFSYKSHKHKILNWPYPWPINYHEWPRRNFSLEYQYNINQTSDENKEKYQFGDN